MPARTGLTARLRRNLAALALMLVAASVLPACTAHDDRFGHGPSVVLDRSIPPEQLEPLQVRVLAGSTIIGVQGPGWMDPRVALIVESPGQARWPLMVRIPWQQAQRIAAAMTGEFDGGPPVDRGLQTPVVVRFSGAAPEDMAPVRIDADATITVETLPYLGSNRLIVETNGDVIAAIDLSPRASWECAQSLRQAAAVQP